MWMGPVPQLTAELASVLTEVRYLLAIMAIQSPSAAIEAVPEQYFPARYGPQRDDTSDGAGGDDVVSEAERAAAIEREREEIERARATADSMRR